MFFGTLIPGTCDREILTYTYGVIHYDVNGNAWRLFLANDRPSAARFLLMLLFFPHQNLKAIGGYLTKHEYLLITKDLKPASAQASPLASAAEQGSTSGVQKTAGGSRRLKKHKKITKGKGKQKGNGNKKTRKNK